jgi:hypothetical protein
MSSSFRDERAGERDGGGGGRRGRRDRLRRVRQNDPEILNEDQHFHCQAAVITLKSNVYLVINMYYIISAYCKESNNNTKDLIYCNGKIYMIYIFCCFYMESNTYRTKKQDSQLLLYNVCCKYNYTNNCKFLLREIRNVIIIIGLVGVLQTSPPCEEIKT